MANIPTYCTRKHGLETPDYIHPKLEPILRAAGSQLDVITQHQDCTKTIIETTEAAGLSPEREAALLVVQATLTERDGSAVWTGHAPVGVPTGAWSAGSAASIPARTRPLKPMGRRRVTSIG